MEVNYGLQEKSHLGVTGERKVHISTPPPIKPATVGISLL